MKASSETLAKLEQALSVKLTSLGIDKGTLEFVPRQWWDLASAAGCLAWLYNTPEQLNDANIETAFKAIHRKWLLSL